MGDGGYLAKNGSRTAQNHRVKGTEVTVGEDFPLLCETCLGQNSYVRMIKLPFGEKLCKVTNVPYQAFRWKAGPNGRYKETIICYTVAAERNICQTCLNDMKFGLPAGLRDRILNGTEDGHESGSVITLPQSNVGLQYYYQQQNQLISQGLEYDGINTSFSNEIQQLPATKQLQKFSNTMKSVDASSKTAFRNLPKLCSFWLNGACNRVVKKTCPFRPCCGAYAFPEIAGSHKEMCKTLVADLTEHGPAYMMKHLTTEVKQALAQALKGNRDEAIRKRVSGEDDLTHQYLGKMKNMNTSLQPPQDPSNTTLWLGGIDESISEQDIVDQVYAYGIVTSVFISRSGKCAFVQYANRTMAEHAATHLYNSLVIHGRSINVNWSKSKGQGSVDTEESTNSSQLIMMPPPGLEQFPITSYSLTGNVTYIPGISTSPPTPPTSEKLLIPDESIKESVDKFTENVSVMESGSDTILNENNKRNTTSQLSLPSKQPRFPSYPSVNPSNFEAVDI